MVIINALSMYYPRLVDSYLLDWKTRSVRKPILLRGARQDKESL